MDQKSNSLRARGHLGKLVGFPGSAGHAKNEPKIVKKMVSKLILEMVTESAHSGSKLKSNLHKKLDNYTTEPMWKIT